MSLDDIRFQEEARQLVERAMGRSRVPHAYVFHGPDGVGKRMFALALASQLLQHTEGPLDAHPDLHIIYRQLNRSHPDPVVRRRKALTIGIDVIRHFMIDRVWLTPVMGVAKVFVVLEAERLQPQAQHAMLKTLEEPPDHTFLLLLTNSMGALLPTIHSRCQSVPFGLLPDDFVRERLATTYPDLPDDALAFYARSAGGSIGAAVRMAEQGLFDTGQTVASSMAQLTLIRVDEVNKTWSELAGKLVDVYTKDDPEITKTEASRRGFVTVFSLASSWLADAIRIASGADLPPTNQSKEDAMARWVEAAGIDGVAACIRRISRAEYELGRSVNVALCVENLINDLGRMLSGERIAV